MSENEKINSICFWLIKKCLETAASKFKIEQENVTFEGKQLGNWRIIVEKI